MLVGANGTDDGIHAVILPVEGVHIPLDWIVAAFGGCFDDIVVVIAIRRTEQKHFITGQVFYLIVYFHYLLFFFIVGKLTHIFMVFAVVAQIVSGIKDGFYVVWIAFHPSSGCKKGYMDIVFGQYLQDPLCIFVSPGGIKRKRDLFFISFHAINWEFSSVNGA